MTPEVNAQALLSNNIDIQPRQRGEVDSQIEADATSVLRGSIENVDGVRLSVSRLPKAFQEAYESASDIPALEFVVKRAIGRQRYEELLPEIQQEVNSRFPGADVGQISEVQLGEDGLTEVLNTKNRLDAYFKVALAESKEQADDLL